MAAWKDPVHLESQTGRYANKPRKSGRKAARSRAQAQPLQLEELPSNCDPYLRWAVLNKWRGFLRFASGGGLTASGQPAPRQKVRIIARACDGVDWQALGKLVKIPDLYQPLPAGGSKGKPVFFTATVALSSLGKLLTEFKQVEWELSATLQNQREMLVGTARAYRGQQADYLPVASVVRLPSPKKPDASEKWERSQRSQTAATGTIAVIDFGCPFLHECLADKDNQASRLDWLWDQGDRRLDAGWARCTSGGYGGELVAHQLAEAWNKVRQPRFIHDEARVYAGLNYLIDYQDPRRRIYLATHGAHVLDVAGGALSATSGSRDPASNARLMFVQLPFEAAADSSGGSLSAYLLDALTAIFKKCPDDDQPLVVNISYGATAGPHDGTSLIEQAMDALLESRPKQTAIVLAAGNARQSALHARRYVSPDSSALFRLDLAPCDSTDTFVEFWYSAMKGSTLEFRVRNPAGGWCAWLGPNSYLELADDLLGDHVAAFIHQSQVPNGGSSMGLLALRPTDVPQNDDGLLAEPGLWEIEVRMTGIQTKDPIAVHARIERDDPRAFAGRRHSMFVGVEPSDAEDSLCSIATGAQTVVVGGFRQSNGMEVAYSSTSPRRKDQWPMVFAVCERDSIDQGLRAAAVRSGETLLMNGTSVAAPVMTREIYNILTEAANERKKLNRRELLTQLQLKAEQPGALIRVDPLP